MSEYGTGMGIGNKLVFDVNGNVEDFTFVLSQKNLNHLGQIQNIERESIDHKGNLNSASEISFVVYKSMNGKDERLWDEIIDFRLVWVRELNKYFQMHISLDDSNDTYKTVTCMSLCEAELSELNVTLEVNNTNDPNWNTSLDEYKKTVFCDVNNKDVSLLHRIIADKAPHYTIGHVDSSLMKLQRSFSFKDTSIYDVFVNQVAKEFNCIFIFDSSNRTINAYDLLTTCNNANCNYRDNDYEFYDNQNNHVCPKCGHTSLSYFGTDTTIFVDNEQLGESIKLEIDEGSVKNCFKLVAGDNTITSLVRELNMNGSDRIYNFPPEQIIDMSDELVEKMNAYNTLYSSKEEEYEQTIVDINEAYDKINYYSNTMMPTVEHSEVTSKTEGEKLTVENLSPLGVEDLTAATQSIVENYLLSYAKVYVKTGYVKLEIKTNSWSKTSTKGTWNGYFIITNYSDEEDIYTTENLTIIVNDDYEEFLNQKLKKSISSSSDEESVLDVLSIDNLNKFKEALTLYCRERLLSFQSAINGAILVLVEQNQSSKDSELYDDLYLPYNEKLKACDAEISIRESQIKQWQDALKHLQDNKTGIQSVLNFKTYLGDELYKEFCSFVREQTYENSNYVSDNLTDSEQIELAKEFISKAKKELVKSSNYQHSISTTLNNLLLIPEFKPILHYFELGNFIRVKVDDYIYRLRLISYHLSFSDLNNLNVTFSDVTKQRDVDDDLKDIVNSVSSMSGSYNYVSQQAEKGEIANRNFEQMFKEGLDSALIRIKSNNNEDFIIDEHGILGRQFSDITGEYDPEQVRFTHNILCFTDDNWITTRSALGKHDYWKYEDDEFVKYTAFGLTSDFVTAGYINGSQIIGGEIYSTNFIKGSQGTYFDLINGDFQLAGGKFLYNSSSSKLTIKDVIVDWTTTTTPEISDIDGLTEDLEQKSASISANADAIAAEVKRASKAEGNLSASIKINADAITSEVKRATESEGNLSSKIEQTAEYITSTVSKTYETKENAKNIYNTLETSITQTAESIELKVSKDSIISTINQSAEEVSIKANKISLEGIVTANNYFKILSDGSMVATNGTFTGTITAKNGSIAGFTISNEKLYAGTGEDNDGVMIQSCSSDSNRYWVFAAGSNTHETYAESPFRVSKYGELYAIKGVVGGWTLGETLIKSNNDENGFRVYLHCPTELGTSGNGNADVLVVRNGTSSDNYTYPFVLSSDGSFTATKANITGTINATSGSFSGSINSTTGNIAGFTITNGKLYSGTGENNDIVAIQSCDESRYWAFAAGGTTHETYSNAPFRVSKTGELFASNATIEGKITSETGSISGWELTNGKIISGTKSGEIVAIQSISDNINWVFAVGGSSHTSYGDSPFRVSKNGELYATKANITGEVNATSGSFSGSITSTSGYIGGWKIIEGYLYNSITTDKANSCGMSSGTAQGGDDNRIFWAGKDNFKVDIDGKVTATNIVATGGSIGGWAISSSQLKKEDTTNGFMVRFHCPTELGSPGNGNADVLVVRNGKGTDSSPYSYPFGITSDGTLTATKANITGSVTATSGTIGGCSISDGTLQIKSANITGTLSGKTITGGTISGTTITSNSATITGGSFKVDGSSSTDVKITVKYGSSYKTEISPHNVSVGVSSNFTSMTSGGFYVYKNGSPAAYLDSTGCYIGGSKSRIATTENYNQRLLYCYETPTPTFGDIGEGAIDETGKCYVFLDDIFAETIDTDCSYQVFLQSYGKGECYVTERTSSYFIVEGTANLSFGWEIKSVQLGYDTIRLEEFSEENIIYKENSIAEETYGYLESLLFTVDEQEYPNESEEIE